MRYAASKGLFFLLFLMLSTTLWSGPPMFAQHEEQVNYQIILKLKAGKPVTQEVLDKIAAELHLPLGLQVIRPMAGNAYLVKMKPSQIAHALQQTKLSKFQLFTHVMGRLNTPDAKKTILYASEDLIHPLERSFLPPKAIYDMNFHAFQWDEFLGPAGVELESSPGLKDLAWQLTQGSPSVIVAIIDTGLEPNVDLNDNVLPGWNFVTDTNDVSDVTTNCVDNEMCHGTHVAGTVAALGLTSGENTLPIGMGPQLKILPENVFSSSGANDSDIIDAMYWAVGDTVPGAPFNPYPANVLNLSLGSVAATACSSAYQDAIQAINTRALIVFAAGNKNDDAGLYSPGNCTNIVSSGAMTIAATDIKGLRASYSNYGSTIDLAAPGGEDNSSPNGILSTNISNTFVYMAGTSMAAPHVAGIAGLIYSYSKSLNMNLTPQQVQNLLLNNVSQFGASADPNINCKASSIKSCGAGIVNAFAALKAVNYLDKAVFVPPAYTLLNLQTHSGAAICQSGLVIPALSVGAKIAVQDNNYTGYWQVVKTGCATEATFQSPVIKSMVLQYGSNNQFAFISPPGLTCRIIEDRSIGCR